MLFYVELKWLAAQHRALVDELFDLGIDRLFYFHKTRTP
jgi:hypothetical protein